MRGNKNGNFSFNNLQVSQHNIICWLFILTGSAYKKGGDFNMTVKKRENTKGIAKKIKQKIEFTKEDKEKFENYCSDGLSHKMIAFKFRTNEARLYERVYRAYSKEEFAEGMVHGGEIIDYFREQYRTTLHNLQRELAFKEDRGMLVWLGKNELGQSDVARTEFVMKQPKIEFSDDDYTK